MSAAQQFESSMDEALTALARKKPWSRNDAEKVLEAWRASGTLLEPFAQKYGLVAQRLRWWSSKLEASVPQASPSSGNVTFAQVRVVRRKRPAAKSRSFHATKTRVATSPSPINEPLEVKLANGRCVRVPPTFDATSLTRLLVVLEELPC
jgi:hypothetical protein